MSFHGNEPRGAMRPLWVLLAGASAMLGALGMSGCTTEAYCFSNCNSGGATSSSGDSMSTSSGAGNGQPSGAGGADCFPFCGTSNSSGNSSSSGAPGCVETNNGDEICDGIDNNCNGIIDDTPGLDPTSLTTCGSCSNNCLVKAVNCNAGQIGCSGGACTCAQCATDYYDLDKNGSCEYYCVTNPGVAENTCNNRDDDCDGLKDEEVDLCNSLTDCGKCGHNCVVLHGTPKCEHTGTGKCDATNTDCAIAACDCTGPGNCWHDLDNSAKTGCEYQCFPSNNGIEICGDGIDNDCNGKIDEADDLSKDPQIGQTCFGDPDGECATAAHAGKTQCVGNKVVCAGANVLKENQNLETCNGKDDDCDGVVDDSPTDAGASCGTSAIFPCALGTKQCQNGQLVCIGAINPGNETCNGQDDDCDGQIDKTNGQPPPDSVGTCNVPIPPPTGATSPCQAGTKACVGGTVQCVGSKGPTGTSDTCDVDANCDGVLSNQPDKQTDVHNCGACGNDCLTGAVHANFACVAGACKFNGCQPGFFDLDGDGKCEYACNFVSQQEACNGADDNCNGQTDENIAIPSATQVCGVSPSATSPECTTGVTVACVNGAFKCTFPAGVCSTIGGNGQPSCATTPELCDTIDNNCNGLLNENVPNFGKPCASDDGLPPPGHGACRTTGTVQCTSTTTGACTAVKNNAAAGPELCDGIDNDCDGSIDEPFNARGTNGTFFVKPAVTKVASALWVMSYEASRPNATNVVPGTGNGFFTSAPAGTTLDKTPACSVPGKIPWFNVTGQEVEQTCAAIGGTICSVANWQTACHANNACKWGYAPRAGTACTTPFVNPGKFCNLGISYDFSSTLPGDQDGLLASASGALTQCFADWSNLLGNTTSNDKIFDITGNLREIAKIGTNQYNLLGGAFDSQSEDGSSCDFKFYTVDEKFKFFDTGFRCCFIQDPTLPAP